MKSVVVRAALAFAGLALACSSSSSGVDAKARTHVNIIRGGTWHFHTGGDPCGDDARTQCTFALPPAESSIARRQLCHGCKPKRMNPAVAAEPFAKLKLSTTQLEQMGSVALSFTLYNGKPTTKDWIGVFCNDDENHEAPDTEYIDWRYTGNASAGTLHFGPLANMRCVWQFRYFATTNNTVYTNLGVSPSAKFVRGPTEPTQVRVGSTVRASEMRVSWVSARVTAPTVLYGSDPTSLTKCALATGDSYSASDMCHAPATNVSAQYFRDPGVLYSAVLIDLAPEQTYYYKVGDSANTDLDTTAKMFTFRTPPAPGKQSKVASYFVYGDLGDWNIKATGSKIEQRTATTIELMRRDMHDAASNYVAAMHNGDLSYAMGRTYLWDQFGAMIEPVASAIPYMVGIGNHEYCHTSGGAKDPSGAPDNGFHPPEGNYGSDSQGECGVPTNKRFIMPENGNRMFWWSVEYGLVHHTQISSEHDYTPGSPMHSWLERDLQRVDRTKTPWLFLYLHRPMYTSEQYDSDYKVSLFIRKHLEPLLGKYKVDVVFSGHYHAYELTCPVFNGTCRAEAIASAPTELAKAKAPVHIMVGSAGADIDNTGYYDVPWRVAAELNYGYGRVHVHNATHAQWEFVRNAKRAVTSSTWIISDHSWVV